MVGILFSTYTLPAGILTGEHQLSISTWPIKTSFFHPHSWYTLPQISDPRAQSSGNEGMGQTVFAFSKNDVFFYDEMLFVLISIPRLQSSESNGALRASTIQCP